MTATLLELCRRVADACNVPRPAAVARASDPTSRRLLSCAREEIRLLAAAGDWQELHGEAVITLNPGVASYALRHISPEIDRIVNDTVWNRTTCLQLTGPLTSRQRQALAARRTGTGLVQAYSLIGDGVSFWPSPTAPDEIAFEFISAAPVLAGDGVTGRRTWEDDADTPRLDEYLVELGMRWRFLKSVNLEHQEIMALYESEKARRLARGGGAPVLSLTGNGDIGFADQAPGVDWRIVNLPAGQL